ncbi:TRAP transporter small permease [Rhizobium laguerreae]|nr:TRAP transporter small permease [Rhizobium laguerreae]
MFLLSVTVVDIVARRVGLFNVRGVVEISTMAVVLVGFLGLSHSFLLGGHIVVDLATKWLPRRANDRIDAIAMLVAAVCLTIVVVFMWRATARSYFDNAISLDLQIPMFAFWLPATIGMSLAPVACVVSARDKWRGESVE